MSDFAIIIEQLRGTLKLEGMAEACYDVSKMPVHMRPSLEALLAKMIETEIRHRDDARTQKLLKAAKVHCRKLCGRCHARQTFQRLTPYRPDGTLYA